MQVFSGPLLAEAGVGVDHLPEEDPGLHQGLRQSPRVGHVHVPVLGAVSNQQRVVTKIFHVSVGHENKVLTGKSVLVLATVFPIHIHRVG